jgi:SAM-dependent methyltransferase
MRGRARLRRLARKVPLPGRVAPPRTLSAHERDALLRAPIDVTGLGLEIGPSHHPLMPKRDGYNVRVADHLDREGLVAKYAQRVANVEEIEEVDYVLEAGTPMADQIAEKFDYVAASHVIEHTVCLISFLEDCERLMRDGGVLTLAVPDRRWCFDRFRERSSLGRVVDTYFAKPPVHTPGSLLEYHLNLVKRDGRISWGPGNKAPYSDGHGVDDAAAAKGGRYRMELSRAGEYIDMHNWVFTPNHFRLLMFDLHQSGFTRLREVAFQDTIGIEFFVALSTGGSGSGLSRHQLVTLADAERRPPDVPTWA